MFLEEKFRKKQTVYPATSTIEDEHRAVIQANSPYLAEQFIQKYCNRVSNLQVGNVYYFDYSPKLAEKLRMWDYSPCSYIYSTIDGIEGINYIGLNIHFIRGKYNRLNMLNGNMLSGSDYEKAVKEYIPHRAANIYLVPKKFYDVAVLTQGKIKHRKTL